MTQSLPVSGAPWPAARRRIFFPNHQAFTAIEPHTPFFLSLYQGEGANWLGLQLMLQRDKLAEAAHQPDPDRKDPANMDTETGGDGAGGGSSGYRDGDGASGAAAAAAPSETWTTFIAASIDLETGQPMLRGDAQSVGGWQKTVAAAASVITARFPCQLAPVPASEHWD